MKAKVVPAISWIDENDLLEDTFTRGALIQLETKCGRHITGCFQTVHDDQIILTGRYADDRGLKAVFMPDVVGIKRVNICK